MTDKQLKIYLVTQDVVTGYDTYDSFVVCAADEQAAKLYQPWGDKFEERHSVEDSTNPMFEYLVWPKYKDIDKIEIKLIGVANPETKPGVILASYNAG